MLLNVTLLDASIDTQEELRDRERRKTTSMAIGLRGSLVGARLCVKLPDLEAVHECWLETDASNTNKGPIQ